MNRISPSGPQSWGSAFPRRRRGSRPGASAAECEIRRALATAPQIVSGNGEAGIQECAGRSIGCSNPCNEFLPNASEFARIGRRGIAPMLSNQINALPGRPLFTLMAQAGFNSTVASAREIEL